MKIFFKILLCLFFTAALGQELTLPVKFLSETPAVSARFMGTDTFGWQYTIENNELRKMKDRKSVGYKAVSLGEIHSVDLQNPLQLVVFYRKFNTVVLLDNQLNETARINFSDLPEPLIAEAVGLAAQNRLWVYDVTRQQIGLYNPSGKDFKTVTPPFNEIIKNYHTDYNYFYWIDTKYNFYAVNLFGSVSFLGTVPPYDRIQILSSTQMLLQAAGELFLYNPAKTSLAKIGLAEKSFAGFYYKDQFLSIFTNTEINQYQITLPK